MFPIYIDPPFCVFPFFFFIILFIIHITREKDLRVYTFRAYTLT